MKITLLTKDNLLEYGVNISDKARKLIMKKWRINDGEKVQDSHNVRSSVDITSGTNERLLVKTPNMLETPKALDTIISKNSKDETMDNQQGQQVNLKPSETTKEHLMDKMVV